MLDLPEQFVEKMKEILKEEAEPFFLSYERERALGLRRNPLKLSKEEFLEKMPFSLEKIPWAGDGYYYQAIERPGRHVYHEAGAYYIQEPSAMAVAEVLGAKPGERILDLCAAPGGKTTQIAGAMKGEGLLVSNEIHPARAKILSQNVERMGARNVVVLNEAPENLCKRFPEYFDKLLVDAPCSGEGMFHKELEEDGEAAEWSSNLVESCAKRQEFILEQAAGMLKPGGYLVYSTCTFSPEENERVIEDFLNAHPEFELVEIHGEEFGRGRKEWLNTEDSVLIAKTVRLWPHQLRGEGHFIAKLKKEDGKEKKQKSFLCGEKNKKKLEEYTGFAKDSLVNEKMFQDAGFLLSFLGDTLYAVPEGMIKLDGIRVLRAGLEIGKNRKNRFEPSHALGMALKSAEVNRAVTLSLEEAACYQKGESISKEAPKGWSFMETEGIPMGIAKSVNGVMKNHYPKGIRR